jgi:8-oxo-dGTP diphosphatase
MVWVGMETLEQLLRASAEKDQIARLVVGALIQNQGGQFLLLKRASHDFMGGIEELPSGKVEVNETIFTALAREVQEETDLLLLGVTSYINHFDYKSKTGTLTRQFNFLVRVRNFNSIKLNAEEHGSYLWVEWKKLDLSDATLETKNTIRQCVQSQSSLQQACSLE